MFQEQRCLLSKTTKTIVGTWVRYPGCSLAKWDDAVNMKPNRHVFTVSGELGSGNRGLVTLKPTLSGLLMIFKESTAHPCSPLVKHPNGVPTYLSPSKTDGLRVASEPSPPVLQSKAYYPAFQLCPSPLQLVLCAAALPKSVVGHWPQDFFVSPLPVL